MMSNDETPDDPLAGPRTDPAALPDMTQLRAAYDNPDQRAAKAQAAQAYIKANFSVGAIAERYGARLREILKGL